MISLPEKNFRAGFFIAAAVLFLSVVPSRSIMYSRDTSDEKSRELAARPEFDSKARMGGCTAVLIAPDVALCAAHCVHDKETGRVAIQWNGQAKDGTFWKHPTVDLIVVKLDEPFKDAMCTPPYAGRDEENKLVWKVGLGGHGVLGPGATKPSYDWKFRAMSNRIEVDRVPNIAPVTETELRYDFDGPPSEPFTETGTRYEGGTAPGDSGGPLYMQDALGKWFVVGLTSGPRNNFYSDARVSVCIPFIEEKTGRVFSSHTNPK